MRFRFRERPVPLCFDRDLEAFVTGFSEPQSSSSVS